MFLTIATHPLRLATPALWTFRLGSWMTAAWSAATTLAHVGVYTEHFDSVLMWSPLQGIQLGWIVPMLIAATIGACIDVAVMKRSRA